MLRPSAARALVLAALGTLSVACSGPEPETFVLDGPRLTVRNQTGEGWTDVELWVNHYFRLTTPSIEAGRTFQARLDLFVDAYGRRFNRGQMLVEDLRLKAKRPSGEPLEIVAELPKDGLAGALGGKK